VIIGHDRLIVAVDPDPKEAVSTEAGAMNYMNDKIDFAGKSGDGSKSNSGCLNAISNPNKQIRTAALSFRKYAFLRPAHATSLNYSCASGIDGSSETTSGPKAMVFVAARSFLTAPHRTVTVYLQSSPFSRLTKRIIQSVAVRGSTNEASVLSKAARPCPRRLEWRLRL
jgi:uncharacterized protein (AIM24 family)